MVASAELMNYTTNGFQASPSRSHSVVVGRPPNFWLFSNRDGFDLTHPDTPSSPPVHPRITLETTTDPITIAPSKTALIIIDMQNFFLSAAMGRPRGEGHKAEEALLKDGIPAAREAGIQIIWLTWGITEEELDAVPPTVWRGFGFEIADDGAEFQVREEEEWATAGEVLPGMKHKIAWATQGKPIVRKEKKSECGLGCGLGEVELGDGSTIDAGRMLMRDQWNTRLHEPLEAAYQTGLKAKVPDVRFHKTRLSGMWGESTSCTDFLEKRGIRTLLFTGVNTDQCVLATLQDACTKGWDTILLKDGCGSSSPPFTRDAVLYNCQKSWGFTSTCKELARGTKNSSSSS